MTLFIKLKRLLVKQLSGLRWYSILGIIVVYIVVSYALLWFAGEKDVIAPQNFLYWLVVTASTVGYGDLSPTSVLGKYAVVLFIIPVGLGLFAWVIGQFAAFFSHRWRRGVQGLKSIDKENHILVIGWNGQRTLQLLRLLLVEQANIDTPRPIVLCVRADIENPLPGEIDFVKVQNFTFEEDMARTNLHSASCIVVDNAADDVTMTTALYCYSQNPTAHTIAYFNDENLGSLLKKHCPNVECMPSVAVEMMAKSAADPGSSFLHHQLLAMGEGMTQYSIKCPEEDHKLVCGNVFTILKERYDATLIGVSEKNSHTIMLNPALEKLIGVGSTLYYISAQRLPEVDWAEF